MFNFKMLLLQTLVVCCFISKAMQNAIGDVKCNKPADIYFVLDASSSIWGPDYRKQLEFVNSVIRELDLNVVRCGLLTYGNVVREEFGLRTYAGRRQALTHAVSAARQLRGDTHTDKAIRRARERMLEDPREVPSIIVVMTDGKSNEPGLTKMEAELTHRRGITTFAIGIGKSIDQNELKSIASHEDYLFTVDNFDALVAIKGMLREKACEVKFVPQPVELPQNTEGCRERPTDVVLMLDSSSNVRSQDFALLLKFTNDLISDLPLSTNGVRVGVATYSNIPKQQISLGEHTSPDALSRAVNRISQHRGRTNMATALRHLLQHSFSTSQASNNLRKIAIIITASPSDRHAETSIQAQLLHEHNIQVFAVGVGPAVDRRELETIASYPKQQRLMTADSFSNLQSLKEQLVDKICSLNGDVAALDRGVDTVMERGQRSTTTSTTQESTTETTPTPMPTTTTEAPSGCGTARPADIVFAISSTANSYEATEALEFIRSFAERMVVTPSAVRIGLAPRNCLSLPGFMLDQGTNKAQILSMFETNYPKPMLSETASTIQYLRNISFKKESGARENAKKIGVLIIDGPVRNFAEAVEESLLARQENIELFLIGVGSQTSVEEMTMLASSNSQHTVMTVSSYSHLKRLTKKLIHSANQHCISQ